MPDQTAATPSRRGLLDLIERIGNALPDPNTLFLIGTLLIMVLSHVAFVNDWSVREALPRQITQETVDAAGNVHRVPVIDQATSKPRVEWVETDKQYKATSLLTRDGAFWAIRSMIENFLKFPPLGIVLVAMLGIGVAERTGLIAAGLKAFMLIMPGKLLTPALVFIGVNSSIGSDSGYVVLPPLAAALYLAIGRSPVAGIAAVFAGIAGGFSANVLITGSDPMLAGLTQVGARVVDPEYHVNPLCNWYFMIVSTVMITFVGWAVTAWFVEPRLNSKPPDQGGPSPQQADISSQRLSAREVKGLMIALAAMLLTLAALAAMAVIPGAPLYSAEGERARWVQSIVPLLFILFIVPGIAYGITTGVLRNDKDVARLMTESMRGMATIIVLAFFAAQFLEHFKYSGLDRMLALKGGLFLGQAGLPTTVLIIAFVFLVLIFNLFIGSASAKYSIFAPIFVPMFMMVGISPELTQAAYRVGDSVTNIVTPLNAYLLIILVVMQKYAARAGMGTLIATMVPYSIVFTIVWCIVLLIWMLAGWPLGVDGALDYHPQH
jgi:aminobenzoyl-glutamate transport protein